MNGYFKKQIEALRQRHEALLQRPNEMQEETNGVIRRYVYPVLTRQHIPLYKPQNKMFHFCKTFCSKITLVNTIQNVILNTI